MQLEDGNTGMFLTLSIDFSTAVHGSEGSRCLTNPNEIDSHLFCYLAICCYPFFSLRA